MIFVVFVVVLGQWRTAAPSNHRNLSNLAMSRYAARLLQVCCRFADLWKSAPSAPAMPCHPLPMCSALSSTTSFQQRAAMPVTAKNRKVMKLGTRIKSLSQVSLKFARRKRLQNASKLALKVVSTLAISGNRCGL